MFYSVSGFWIHSYSPIVQLFIYFLRTIIIYTMISINNTRMERCDQVNGWCTLFCVYVFFLSIISVLFIIAWNKERFLHFHGQACYCDFHNFLSNLMIMYRLHYRYKKNVAGAWNITIKKNIHPYIIFKTYIFILCTLKNMHPYILDINLLKKNDSPYILQV